MPAARRVYVTSFGRKGPLAETEALEESIAMAIEHVAAPVAVFSMGSAADAPAASSPCEAGCLSPLTGPRRG